jgi:hypothetical protein
LKSLKKQSAGGVFMFTKPRTIACSIAVLFTTVAPAAMAQNFQNWLTNETNKIQQDASSGLITPSQLSKLQQREAQIQQDQQLFQSQNGGILTQGENNKLANELRKLNRGLNNDLSNNGVNNGVLGNGLLGTNGNGGFWRNLFGGVSTNQYVPYTGYNGYNNGLPYTGYNTVPYTGYGGVPYTNYTGYNNGNPYYANGAGAGSCSRNNMIGNQNAPWQNAMYHHHHHHDFQNSGFVGANSVGYPGNSYFGRMGGNGNHYGWRNHYHG